MRTEMKKYKILKSGNLGGVFYKVGDSIMGCVQHGSFYYGKKTSEGIPLTIPSKFVKLS